MTNVVVYIQMFYDRSTMMYANLFFYIYISLEEIVSIFRPTICFFQIL